MSFSNAKMLAISQLKVYEGLKLKPYRDTVGKLTIGYGRNLDDNGIGKEEAEAMLNSDVETVTGQLKSAYPWFESLDYARQAVVINMAFNMGMSKFAGFAKMIAAIRAEDYSTATAEMLDSRWAAQVGARALKLSAMMKTGDPRAVP